MTNCNRFQLLGGPFYCRVKVSDGGGGGNCGGGGGQGRRPSCGGADT